MIKCIQSFCHLVITSAPRADHTEKRSRQLVSVSSATIRDRCAPKSQALREEKTQEDKAEWRKCHCFQPFSIIQLKGFWLSPAIFFRAFRCFLASTRRRACWNKTMLVNKTKQTSPTMIVCVKSSGLSIHMQLLLKPGRNLSRGQLSFPSLFNENI